jgi:hypothetical protein
MDFKPDSESLGSIFKHVAGICNILALQSWLAAREMTVLFPASNVEIQSWHPSFFYSLMLKMIFSEYFT